MIVIKHDGLRSKRMKGFGVKLTHHVNNLKLDVSRLKGVPAIIENTWLELFKSKVISRNDKFMAMEGDLGCGKCD
jgi:hypothetical protein